LKLAARLLLAEPPQLKRSVGLATMNGIMERLSNRKWRAMLGRYLFGREQTEDEGGRTARR
jgi:hypothetical protein